MKEKTHSIPLGIHLETEESDAKNPYAKENNWTNVNYTSYLRVGGGRTSISLTYVAFFLELKRYKDQHYIEYFPVIEKSK